MVFIGMTILGAGFLLFSQVRELWHLYATFFVMSLGAALGTWLPMMTVMNHWFIRRKTRAMSLVMEGFAIGGIILPLLLAWSVGGVDPNISERYGWRATAFAIGILVIALAFPLSRLVRNRPEDLGLRPDGDPPAPDAVHSRSHANAGDEAGFTWQEAIRTRDFWLMSIGHALASIVGVSVLVHLGLLLDDRGFSLQAISAVVATFTAVSAVFLMVGGYLGDRFSIKLAAFGFSAIQSVAVVVLVFFASTPMVFLFAVLLGVAFGGRIPVTTAMRGVYFGRKAFAAITGISGVPLNIMLFSAPLFAGYMRDITGRYDVAFLTIAGVCLLGSCFFLLLGEPKVPGPRTRRQTAAAAA
jgi:MFS family permease